MNDSWDTEMFSDIISENINEARRHGLSDEQIAAVLLEHRDSMLAVEV